MLPSSKTSRPFLSSQKAEVTVRVIIQLSLQGCDDDSNLDSALFEMPIVISGLVVTLSIFALNLPPAA